MAKRDTFRKLAFDTIDAYDDYDPYGMRDAMEYSETWSHFRNRVARVMIKDREQILDCISDMIAYTEEGEEMRKRADALYVRYMALTA